MATDRLIFQADPGQQINLPWSGAWPPPERLYLVVERKQSAFGEEANLVLVDPETQSEETLVSLVIDHGAVLYTLSTASQIPEPAGDDENWFRGALYEPWNLREALRDGGL